jgi:hypothetical protein
LKPAGDAGGGQYRPQTGASVGETRQLRVAGSANGGIEVEGAPIGGQRVGPRQRRLRDRCRQQRAEQVRDALAESGGTWQVAHFDGPLKTILPRSNAALSYAPKGKLPAGVCLIIIDGVDGPTSTASKCQGVGAGALSSRPLRPNVSKRPDHSETRLGVVFSRSATELQHQRRRAAAG